MKKDKSIALPLAVSIIAISFAPIFVKMSSAPFSILSMYRLWIITFIMLPIAWRKREEFHRIQQKDWYFLIGSDFFSAAFFIMVCLFKVDNSCKRDNHFSTPAHCILSRRFLSI